MSWIKSLIRGRSGPGAHARPTALGFTGPQGLGLPELLGDVTGRGAHRYAPEMVAWMQAQYEATLAQAEDCHTDAVQALEAEAQLRVRAADMRYWLLREAGVAFDDAEPLRNGEYFPPAETGTVEQGRSDVTAFYAQQSADESGEDAPLYGHWIPQPDTSAEPQAEMTPTREFAPIGGDR